MAEGRGERTIGSGHLVALFLGIVVLCCVFFILGYEMGRAQFEKSGSAAVATKPAATTSATPAKEEPAAPGWPSATPSGGSTATNPAATSASSAPPAASKAPAKASGNGGHPIPGLLKAPEIPRGSIVLQVAANRNESDALNLAKLLQEKGFPAFVLTPSTDDWYRVQVGPFPDAKSAEQAKTALAHEGFKAIAKR
ncbi:MAG TPA: SPOR domain-containing protein [Patescibacteria group bacterium]|nr:SPOR domain-containing protein [Patescibacteria group bacterium]